MFAVAWMRKPLLSTVFAGWFSMAARYVARFRELTAFAARFTVNGTKVGFAGAVTVMTAGAPNVAKRRYTGESPWEAATDGATNQKRVSTCARTSPPAVASSAHTVSPIRSIPRM